MLAPEQVEAYREAGFVLLPRFVAGRCLKRYNARFLALVRGQAQAPAELVIMRDIMVVKGVVEQPSAVAGVNKLFHFHHDPVLFDYAQQPRLLAIARQLTGAAAGAPLGVVATNVFNKPPGVDGRHPLHQDLRYFRQRPADGIVGTWTAMSHCRRESGCLAVVPGSHRGPLHPHREPDWEHVNHAFLGIDGARRDALRHLEMRPGDTLFFHPLLIHGSGRNRGAECRRAISAHFAAPHCEAPGEDWPEQPHVRLVGQDA